MQLTANFKLDEFKCKDGCGVPDPLLANVQDLANNLQVLRDHIGKPISIMSGYRTPEYNLKCGGELKSQHMEAKAADIQVGGMKPVEVCATIKQLIADGKMKQGGVGLYDGWVHYDVRGFKARWGGA
jgi:uncharacterized protein YcbK (DUF882 family)